MIREIGLATIILIVLTAAIVLVAIGQTTEVGFLASGVTDDVALTWGQNADMVSDEGEAAGETMDDSAVEDAGAEATEEATEEAGE